MVMLRTGMLGPLLWPFVHRGLGNRFDRAVIRAIFDEALASYEGHKETLPRERSAGGRLMVNLAALTVALYRVLRARDVPEAEARALTARVTWQAYEKMAVVPTMVSKIGTKPGRARLERATRAFRRFPFGPPAYAMEDVETTSDTVAFDVRRCPVAEYFISQGLGALCVESWCNLDFPLAQSWEATLERHRTLAAGDDRCDFRWHSRAVRTEPEPGADHSDVADGV